MPEITTPTVRLFVPKFDGVVRVNADEESKFRTEFGARGEHEAAPEPSAPARGKPFLTKAEKEAAAAAEKEAAEAAAKLASDAKP